MTEIADRKQAILVKLWGRLFVAIRFWLRVWVIEQYRIVNGKRIPWNDKKVVQEIISESWEKSRKISL